MTRPAEIRGRQLVVARLCRRFPDAPTQRVVGAVASGFDRYANARVRDFVELLVEREAADELRAPSKRAASAHDFPASPSAP
jgi:hypothetical protein